jgi:hypothetical protein
MRMIVLLQDSQERRRERSFYFLTEELKRTHSNDETILSAMCQPLERLFRETLQQCGACKEWLAGRAGS